MDAPTLFDPAIHAYLLPSIVSVHAACILSPPYTIATFLPPLSDTVMLSWWTSQARQVADGTRLIVMQLAKNEQGEEVVAGVVALGMPFSETGPYRGYVEKLLVSPERRKKGIARKLMEKLEIVGKGHGRTLFILDTEEGSPAQLVYPRLGYTLAGTIPRDMTSPKDGVRKGAALFYKDLEVST